MIFLTHTSLGTNANGATRWLQLGPIQIQPSELIKPFLVLQSARIFGQWHKLRLSIRLSWLCIFAVVLLAILRQPSLSMTALCGITLWLVALAAGLPYFYLLDLGSFCSGLFPNRNYSTLFDPFGSNLQHTIQLILFIWS